jgi:hypothetical protein
MIPRFDFVATYWVLAWWVLYYTGVLPFNPKLFLVAAILVNVLEVTYIQVESRALYLLVGIGLTKLLPLALIWNSSTQPRDLVFGAVMGLVYLSWLKLNNEPVVKVRTPMMDFLRKYNLSTN